MKPISTTPFATRLFGPMAFSIALLSGIAFASCADQPFDFEETSWEVTWSYQRDVQCTESTELEVNSRTTYNGTARFRVTRAPSDNRSIFELENIEVIPSTIVLTQRYNCDARAHDYGVVVTKAAYNSPLQMTGAIIDSSDGVDILTLELTGRTVAPVIRFRMTATGEAVDVALADTIRFPIRLLFTASGSSYNQSWSTDAFRFYHRATAKLMLK